MTNFYIGWDVGAWKCTKGKNDSCDALVVIDDSRIIGYHRNNLGETIRHLFDSCAAERPSQLIKQWFSLCEIKDNDYSSDDQYYIAIDTPLGWPKDFKGLLDGTVPVNWSYQPISTNNIDNTLLYRYTERAKLKSGLSVIVDSIGSQSTKGMLLLQLLGAKCEDWGIWKASNNITLFETYPKACLVRAGFVAWMAELNLNQILSESFKVQVSKKGEKPKRYGTVSVIAEDVFDAGVCACVARAFAAGSPKLVRPTPDEPVEWKPEGWIFYPDQEGVVRQAIADNHKAVTCCESVTTFQEAIQAFQKHLKGRNTPGRSNPSGKRT